LSIVVFFSWYIC